MNRKCERTLDAWLVGARHDDVAARSLESQLCTNLVPGYELELVLIQNVLLRDLSLLEEYIKANHAAYQIFSDLFLPLFIALRSTKRDPDLRWLLTLQIKQVLWVAGPSLLAFFLDVLSVVKMAAAHRFIFFIVPFAT